MEKVLHIKTIGRFLLIINYLILIVYFSWWFDFSHIGNVWLYSFLFFGELYHVTMAALFWFTIWPEAKKDEKYYYFDTPSVDVFITVAGEPVEVVRQTAISAKNLNYPNKLVYLLNDSYVANKDNWKEIEGLAKEIGVNCITRKIPGGAKAGNINHGLSHTTGSLIVIFDADMVPHPDFLTQTVFYFNDPDIAFVQTPQYYKNFAVNQVSAGAWEQQEFFFGPIMKGKDKSNASFICGTNVVLRREALMDVGGMNENNIAEDFLTSLAIHQRGWKSKYLTEVLAEGLAPEELRSYFKQQLRWARGSLEVLFGANPLFKTGLTLAQRLEYLASALYYFNGVIVLIDILMPLIFLYFNLQPVSASTSSFALFFLPFMFLNLYTLNIVSQAEFSFRAISFSQSSWCLQLIALQSVLLNQKMAFAVTPKQALNGNFLKIVYPHLIYLFLFAIGSGIAIQRRGLDPAVMTNIAWGIFNVILFIPFIKAAYKWGGLWQKKIATSFLD